MIKDDEQLIAEYLEGDEAALGVLVDRYLADVHAFVLHLTRDTQLAEDVTQEAFIKAWKSARRFTPGNSFRNWLFAIARNTAIDWLRKKKSVMLSGALAETLADTTPLPEEMLARAEDTAYVQALLNELSLDYREVLTLRYSGNLTFEEIGHLLRKPLHTVKSQHRRALIALRRMHQNNPATRI